MARRGLARHLPDIVGKGRCFNGGGFDRRISLIQHRRTTISSHRQATGFQENDAGCSDRAGRPHFGWSGESRELHDRTSIMTDRGIAGGPPLMLSRVRSAGSLLEGNFSNSGVSYG
jgi:hypothetical protein